MRLRRPDRQDSTGKGLRHHIEPDEKIRNRGNFHARDTDFPKRQLKPPRATPTR